MEFIRHHTTIRVSLEQPSLSSGCQRLRARFTRPAPFGRDAGFGLHSHIFAMASAAESPAVLFESYAKPFQIRARVGQNAFLVTNCNPTACRAHTAVHTLFQDTMNRVTIPTDFQAILLLYFSSIKALKRASQWNTGNWPSDVACLYSRASNSLTRHNLRIVEGMSRPLPMLLWRWHAHQSQGVVPTLRRPPQKCSSHASQQSGMFFRWVSCISIPIPFSDNVNINQSCATHRPFRGPHVALLTYACPLSHHNHFRCERRRLQTRRC